MSDILMGDNSAYLSNIYQKYLDNPASISLEWQNYFKNINESKNLSKANTPPSLNNLPEYLSDSIRAYMLIQAYRMWGHLIADLDPLSIAQANDHPELDFKFYGFQEKDLDRPIYITNDMEGLHQSTLRKILQKLRSRYCGKIGVEFMHLQDSAQKTWIQAALEYQQECIYDRFNMVKYLIKSGQKTYEEAVEEYKNATIKYRKDGIFDHLSILKDLARAELFEKFLNTKFPGAKRFSGEGCESLILALRCLMSRLSHYKLREVFIGMAHRGRLSVLSNVLNQPMHHIFAHFLNKDYNQSSAQSGDVKYHLGYDNKCDFEGQNLHLSLLDNPSHLESVNPVVLGKVRARQDILGDKNRSQVLGVLIHGDAAFIGQGIVAESLQLSKLQGYGTGGTIHIIVNNQIGFTTNPTDYRSSTYSSDMAKSIQAPIFHVNADSPEDVVAVTQLACDYYNEFNQDVVIDLFCYRKLGHNEGDDPSFTQPLMYQKIANHPSTKDIYINSNPLIDQSMVEKIQQEIMLNINKEFTKAKNYINKSISHKNLNNTYESSATGVKTLNQLGKSICKIPDDFNPHPKIKKWLNQRLDRIENKVGIDWSLAESLAFASLLVENVSIRLSGQDSSRGTFSNRHAILVDQVTGNFYIPLNHLSVSQAKIEIINSPLAEASILGFEYGYSTIRSSSLIIWEAQFGDFSNGAQVIIDEFIASSETKWGNLSNLVMLLPHGMEGQGPDHSSARLERYLQLSAQDNWTILNCSTPANYFHALRNQVSCQNPLLIMTPKSLLRHKVAVSSLDEMGENTSFQKVLKDNNVAKAKRVILCSGKLYYELLSLQQLHNIKDIAIIRIEQLYPFPLKELKEVLKSYVEAEIIWCQEESANMGAWLFVEKTIEKNLNSKINYIGRASSASPATGSFSNHEKTQTQIIEQALMMNTTYSINPREVIYVKNYPY